KPGVWQIDPVGKRFANAPVSDSIRKELVRWYSSAASQASPLTRPKYEGDEISRHLDSITLEEHYIRQYNLSRDFIRTFLSPDLGGGSGLGADALSAYCDYAADLLHPYEEGGEAVQMFPGGNTTIARLMMKSLITNSISGEATVDGVTRGNINFSALDERELRAKIRLKATAVSVHHEAAPGKSQSVSVIYAVGHQLFRVRARSVVMAGGSWTAKHIIRDLPQSHRHAYSQFFRSPCMMANIAVRNWRSLAKLGITGCRWFGSGIGN